MIQITGLRPKAGTRFEDADFEDYSIYDKYKITAESVADLIDDPEKYLKQLPASEHWNLFFTVANCGAKKREFESQGVIAFDLDGIDNTQHERYIEIFCKTLGVKRLETGIVASGNGLHFYIGLQVPIVSKDFFKQNRHHYKALLAALESAIKADELPIGKVDPAIFDARRILRMPLTINKKNGREDKKCYVIQPAIINVPFDITLASGIPTVSKDDALPRDYVRKYPKTDNKAILAGCNFLKFCQEDPAAVSEPQWYAMLSITARMENGNELSHKMSEGHRSYSFEKTEAKIDHAINASPPRKCSGINNLWGACRSCPNFEKVESPIMLRSEDSIPTESTGFHTVTITEKGGVRAAPCYKDLREFFERQNYYVSHSKLCWTYTGTHFEPSEKLMLQNFAQTHFNPYATTGMTTEFENLVLRTNPINPRYWDDSTKRKINFKNGVLDLETMNFLPHSKEYGFKYVLPYEYDPRATAPVFQKFLSDIMISDAEMMQILLEFGGYALSGDDCKGAKALFLVGEGSNGKSTFVKVLKKLAGHNNYQTISLKDFSNMERRHGLDGALFNIAEETPDRVADSNDFKNLVDGGELKVRRLFSDDYTIENRAKLIFTCNTLPESFDTSKGYRRRLLIIPFEADFTDGSRIEDKDMDLKLFKELPGIFNLMIEAYHGFTARGKKFTESSKATATLTEYEEMNNPVVQFIKDKLEVIDLNDQGPKPCWMAADAIFKAYLYYCEEETNQKYTLPRNKFYKRLETALPQFKKRWHKKNAGKAVLGVRMNSSDGKEF